MLPMGWGGSFFSSVYSMQHVWPEGVVCISTNVCICTQANEFHLTATIAVKGILTLLSLRSISFSSPGLFHLWHAITQGIRTALVSGSCRTSSTDEAISQHLGGSGHWIQANDNKDKWGWCLPRKSVYGDNYSLQLSKPTIQKSKYNPTPPSKVKNKFKNIVLQRNESTWGKIPTFIPLLNKALSCRQKDCSPYDRERSERDAGQNINSRSD